MLYMQHLSEEPHLVLYMQHLSEEPHLVLYMQHLSEEPHLVLYKQHLSEEPHLVLYMQHLSEEPHLVLYKQHLSEEPHLVLYMQHLSESTESKAAVEEAVHAIMGTWGLQPFGGSPLVKSTLEGLRRILAKPKVRKEPVTADMLKAMVEAAGSAPSLREVRLLAVCLVVFAGFMRRDELVKLKCADVTFNAKGMVVKIESSKTDQYQDGASLVIGQRIAMSKTPLSAVWKYLRVWIFNLGLFFVSQCGCVCVCRQAQRR